MSRTLRPQALDRAVDLDAAKPREQLLEERAHLEPADVCSMQKFGRARARGGRSISRHVELARVGKAASSRALTKKYL
jgi:hypothetical protein